jgi:type II secretory pathway component PulK
MTTYPMTNADPRRGAVLMTVLWSISLLAALAMAASVTFRGFTGVMSVDRNRVERDALITAGLEVAAGIILDLPKTTPLRDLERTVTLSTGSVNVRLNDEGGRIDIAKAPAEVLAAMLQSAGAPAATAGTVAKAIIEQRGEPRGNAPQPGPAARRPPVLATTHEQALSSIGQIAGMRAQWLAAIAPLTTIYGSETVNPLTAPRGVIAALPGVDANRLEAFLAERRVARSDANRLVQMLGPAQIYVSAKPQRITAVELRATLTESRNSNIASARAVIAVLPQDSEPYRVLVFTPVRTTSLR